MIDHDYNTQLKEFFDTMNDQYSPQPSKQNCRIKARYEKGGVPDVVESMISLEGMRGVGSWSSHSMAMDCKFIQPEEEFKKHCIGDFLDEGFLRKDDVMFEIIPPFYKKKGLLNWNDNFTP